MKAHRNPFAPDRVRRLLPFDPTLLGTNWEAIERDWERLGRRAAVRGHHGSGKTTFLDTFAGRLSPQFRVEKLFLHRGTRYLNEQQDCLLEFLANQQDVILFVDGEGHLKASERRRLRKVSQNLGGYLVARHGRSSLPTLLQLKSNPLLAEILLEKIHPPAATNSKETWPRTFRKKGGNLRELWLSFYDDYANNHDSGLDVALQPPQPSGAKL